MNLYKVVHLKKIEKNAEARFIVPGFRTCFILISRQKLNNATLSGRVCILADSFLYVQMKPNVIIMSCYISCCHFFLFSVKMPSGEFQVASFSMRDANRKTKGFFECKTTDYVCNQLSCHIMHIYNMVLCHCFVLPWLATTLD